MDLIIKTINSLKDLQEVCDSLHDADCQKNDIKYDSAKKALDIVFTERIGWEYGRKSIKKFFWFFYNTLKEFPAVKSHLHLDGVLDCKINEKYPKSNHEEFDRCEAAGNECRLFFHIGTTIILNLQNPIQGYLKDLEFMNFRDGKVNIRFSDIKWGEPKDINN